MGREIHYCPACHDEIFGDMELCSRCIEKYIESCPACGGSGHVSKQEDTATETPAELPPDPPFPVGTEFKWFQVPKDCYIVQGGHQVVARCSSQFMAEAVTEAMNIMSEIYADQVGAGKS